MTFVLLIWAFSAGLWAIIYLHINPPINPWTIESAFLITLMSFVAWPVIILGFAMSLTFQQKDIEDEEPA